jgi:hypothetical protein
LKKIWLKKEIYFGIKYWFYLIIINKFNLNKIIWIFKKTSFINLINKSQKYNEDTWWFKQLRVLIIIFFSKIISQTKEKNLKLRE